MYVDLSARDCLWTITTEKTQENNKRSKKSFIEKKI